MVSSFVHLKLVHILSRLQIYFHLVGGAEKW